MSTCHGLSEILLEALRFFSPFHDLCSSNAALDLKMTSENF